MYIIKNTYFYILFLLGKGGNMKVLAKRNIMGRPFKIYGDIENPLFLARDVANWIGHTNISHMLNMVDDDEKLTYTMCNSGQNREMWFLTEDGLYEVLMQSRKPIAKTFKRKIKEILKTIRKKGVYLAKPPKDEEKLLLAKAVLLMQSEIDEKTMKIKALENNASQDRPKVIFAEAVEGSNHSILIGELAKIIKQKGYDIGQKRLFAWLRENNYLMKKGDSYNMPTQKSMDMRLFEIKESLVTHSNGHQSVVATTKVTGKGQVYFINLFIKKLYEEKYGESLS